MAGMMYLPKDDEKSTKKRSSGRGVYRVREGDASSVTTCLEKWGSARGAVYPLAMVPLLFR
jgi:hypothetical protein